MKRTLFAVFCILLAGISYGSVASAQDSGSITGRVTIDGSGEALAGAEILALGEGKTYYAFSADDGFFQVDVPVGIYLIGVRVVTDDGANVYTEYYDDAVHLRSATALGVEAGQEVGRVDFGVPDLPNIVPAGAVITVSGRAIDAVTGEPVSGALVMAYDFEGVVHEVDTSTTDASGLYSLHLPRYVQRLKAWTFADGYDRQFYYRQPTLHTARDIIIDPAETSLEGIDFELVPLSQGTAGNQVSGRVENDGGLPVSGALIIAYNDATSETRYAVTDAGGHYNVGGLDGGDYYLLVAADGFIPEFYGGVQSWNEATTVEAGGITTGINFLIGGLNRPPIGKGRDMNADGLTTALSGHALNRRGEPVDLAVILAVDSSGNIAGFDISDVDGFFKIENLPAGEYTVSSDRVHYEGDARMFELAEAPHFVQASAFITMTGAAATATNTDDLPQVLTLDQNFPNPFNPATLISYILPETGDVKLSVYDMLGRQIATLVDGPQAAGGHTVRFAAGDELAAGFYFYRLRASGREMTRAMLLLK